jgi:hypothetical protein
MFPYFIFNPFLNYYVFIPDFWIFTAFGRQKESLEFTSYYDIFDGYHHVTLKLPIKVIRSKSFIPAKKSSSGNTAPIIGLNE